MKVHYECEFEIAHPAMAAEYVRGKIDAAIQHMQVAKTGTLVSHVEPIIS